MKVERLFFHGEKWQLCTRPYNQMFQGPLGESTLRAWSVPSVSKPTPAKMRPCGFVKPTPAGFCSRFGGQFHGKSPGCLGICHAFVTPMQSDETLYAYGYCNHLDSTCVPSTAPRRPSKHGDNIGLLCISGGTLSVQGNLTYQL